MEIVNSNCAILCNFEVMQHLRKIKDSKKKHIGQLATITYETLRYLEELPCAEQTPTTITKCIKDLKKYGFNKKEILTLINLLPTTALEIQLMVEESEERLTENQVEEVLQIIIECFPHVKKEQDETQDDPE